MLVLLAMEWQRRPRWAICAMSTKRTTEVWHRDIRNVQMSQGPLQRLLDVGTIGISSAGQSGMEIVVGGIPTPNKVKDLLDQHKRSTLTGR